MEESIKPDYTSIYNILELAEEGKLLLPEFQRPFVWNIEQSKDLFDSLIRGIFIGTFVMSKPQFDLTCRKVDTRPRSGKGSRAKFDDVLYQANHFESRKIEVVLDGQQRITSLYRVLKGYDRIYFVLKNPSELPLPDSDNDFEDIIESLSVKPIEDSICIALDIIFNNESLNDKKFEKQILDPLSEQYDFLQDEELKERYFDLLLELRKLFILKIHDKSLLSVFFLHMGIEKFCMFFERSNSKGTELSFIDIITAKIYKDFKLDREIKKFKEKNSKIAFDNAIIESFVRYFSFLKVKQVDRKSILTNLTGEDFNDNWDQTCVLYKKAFQFLQGQNLIVLNEWLPYKTMYIPIIHFLRHLPHQDFTQMTTEQMESFKLWFWGSLLNTRYGGGMLGSSNDIIVEDCKMLESIASGGKFTKEYLRGYKFDFKFDNLLELTSKGAIFVGIMSIMNYDLPFLNLNNHNKVEFSDSYNVNIHHIFPKKYLEKNYPIESFENENFNTVLNKMIIGKIPNIKFGDKKPSTYIAELNNSLVKESLKSHLIVDADKLIDGTENYKEFLEKRANVIIDVINNQVGVIKEKFLEEFESV